MADEQGKKPIDKSAYDCCCDEMAVAIRDELIEMGKTPSIVIYGEAWYGADDRRYPIKFCPFCGTAANY